MNSYLEVCTNQGMALDTRAAYIPSFLNLTRKLILWVLIGNVYREPSNEYHKNYFTKI